MEIDEDAPLAQSFKRKRQATQTMTEPRAGLDPSGPDAASTADRDILVSEFDNSVENHFKFVDTITKLCKYPQTLEPNQPEIKRYSDSITFLREWRDFNYKRRIVKFACQHNLKEKDVIGGVNLSQFSSASVPKKHTQNGSEIGVEQSKDFVMYVGGAVWALDWCPRVDRDSENCIKSEFVAVAPHPPDSSYHKFGAPLIGRGAIQIWCMLTVAVKDGPSEGNKKSKQVVLKKGTVSSNKLTKVPRPRGRPRKKPLLESIEKKDADNKHAQPLAVEYPVVSPEFNSSDRTSGNASKHVYDEDSARIDKDSDCMEHADSPMLAARRGRPNKRKTGKGNMMHTNRLHSLRQCEHGDSALVPCKSAGFSLDSMSPNENTTRISSSDASTSENLVPTDVALPRMMLCLAHNGKVAWDVKWRPVDAYHPEPMYKMGYLAVLLGNGAVEVWDVPLPHTVKSVYPAFQDRIDPRFIKLKPVFRCSMLKCGDGRSIPQTVEWSVTSPHDMILAGCHDGVVALWKFSVSDSLTETRPLLSFSADTGPIRTLSWAPNRGDLESANIIVTAGNKGFRFWDIRDPFHPLWDHPVQVVTYDLDWLPDPRCVFGFTEDGTMWLLSLEKAAHDLPVAGKCHNMASKHGFHSFDCSAFSLWSVQASRLTGMVAYCGEEGSTHCFQPTTRSLNDPSRNRPLHYLCGSILEEENAIIVASPLPNSSIQRRHLSMKRPGSVKEQEKRAKERIDKSEQALAIQAPKSKKSQLKADQETTLGRREDVAEEFEVFPPKIVAMHRVRWNVNKGSEKWLCYGGAAGLVRCQELDFSAFQ